MDHNGNVGFIWVLFLVNIWCEVDLVWVDITFGKSRKSQLIRKSTVLMASTYWEYSCQTCSGQVVSNGMYAYAFTYVHTISYNLEVKIN